MVKPGCDIDRLFIFPGSTHGNIVKILERRLALKFPTPTLVRKIGSTSAARNLSHAESTVLLRQMSHDPTVSVKHYQAISGMNDARAALRTMEELREKEVDAKMSKSKVNTKPICILYTL